MGKRFLCLFLVICMCFGGFISCAHKHVFENWQTTEEATCTRDGTKTATCSCGETSAQAIPKTAHTYTNYFICWRDCQTMTAREIAYCTNPNCYSSDSREITIFGHSFSTIWDTVKEPTCTEPGLKSRKCNYCNETETETIPAAHSYYDGVCTKCNRGIINIILPETPITVNDVTSKGVIERSFKITSIKISEINDYYIYIAFSGEKTYDEDGNNVTSRVSFAYKLYDSEGYVATSGSTYTIAISVGEKLKDDTLVISRTNLNTNETYTLVLMDAV